MKTSNQTWRIADNGDAVFRMTVEVNGTTHVAENIVSEMGYALHTQPPMAYIERDMRRQLMRVVEKQLFGDVR